MKVYVVSGSEDGILGVFGSAKAAAVQACRYVNTRPGDVLKGQLDICVDNMRKSIRSSNYVLVSTGDLIGKKFCSDNVEAVINKYELES